MPEKKSVDKLQKSGVNFHAVLNRIAMPTLVLTKGLKVKLCNDSSKSIFVTNDDEIKSVITNLAPHINLPELSKRINAVIKTTELSQKQIDTDSICYIERIAPFIDDKNKINGVVLTYTDNTKTRDLEQRLAKSEERFQLAVTGSSVGLWDWHIKEDSLYCSPKMLELLHVNKEPKTMSFEFIKSRIHPDEAEDVMAIFEAHIDKGFEFNVECRLRTEAIVKPNQEKKQTSYIWVHMRGQAVWDEARQAIRMSGSMNDVTDRRLMLDQLRDSNEALSRFAYVCSHDLKEPARIAENFSSLLLGQYEDQLDEEGKEYLHYIQTSTERMQNMIRDMLNYSQIENKSTALEQVNCAEEIEKVIQNLALTIDEKKAQVTFTDLPTIKADRMQIFQLFQNLMSNGLKFSDSKNPKVHVDFKEEEDSWCFSVKDNGIGMKQEHTHQIFNVFQRLNQVEDYAGTGIGLSVCQKIVNSHGGNIWVETAPSKGSTFFFTIQKKLIKRQANNFIAFPKTGS